MSICLISIAVKPKGLIDFDKLEGNDRIFAQGEGVANCTSTLQLKDSEKFIFTSICFGIEKSKGEYKLIKDTIYFIKTTRNTFNPKFAVFDRVENQLIIYDSKNDKNPMHLHIINK